VGWLVDWTYLRLGDLQVPHLDTTGGEVGDLELDIDGSLRLANGASAAHAAPKSTCHTPASLVISLDGRQTQLRPHKELLTAAELFNLPDDSGLFWGIVHGTDVGAEPGRVCVFGNGDDDFDVIGGAAAFELCFGLSQGRMVSKRRRASGS